MLIDNGHMQALFVDPACRGTGIGAARWCATALRCIPG